MVQATKMSKGVKPTKNGSRFIVLTESRGKFIVDTSLIKIIFPKSKEKVPEAYNSTIVFTIGSDAVAYETPEEIYQMLP